MKSVTRTCAMCQKKMTTNENWFNRVSIDTIKEVRWFFHLWVKHNGLTRKGKIYLIKIILLLIPSLAFDFVLGLMKTVTFPFYLIHEML